jgi:molecular chaperone GrpE
MRISPVINIGISPWGGIGEASVPLGGVEILRKIKGKVLDRPERVCAFEWVSMPFKRGEMMMANETQKKNRAATINMGAQPDSGSEDEVSRVSQPNDQQPDQGAVWKDKYVRLYADLENTKKRLIRSAAQEVEAEKEALLRDVLPLADGLDLALMHTSRKEDNRNLLQGIELIRNILNKFFIKYDVKAIDAWGKPFDPRLHEAIGVTPHPKFPPNTVVSVEQKGYLYRDKLLRPAQVLVTSS